MNERQIDIIQNLYKDEEKLLKIYSKEELNTLYQNISNLIIECRKQKYINNINEKEC